MSLAQHVTQGEGFDYEAPAHRESLDYPASECHWDEEVSIGGHAEHAEGRPEWRQMNFALAESSVTEPRLAAYKISDSRRYLQVATGVIACWLASGIVFGFAALKPVLIAEGVYQELCFEDDEGYVPERDAPCAQQDLRLNLFFIAASITTNVASLFSGAALDRYGRRICWLASCVFLAIGCVLMGSSFSIPEFDGYLLANIFLALGGTFLFVPSFQLANAFPKHSGIIVALITGAFDASAAVFLFYRMAYDATEGAFTLEMFFFGYILVPVLIFVAEVSYMPEHAYHTTPELEHKIEKAQDSHPDVHESDEDISDSEELTRVRSARADHRIAKLDQIEDLAGDAEEREERVKIEEDRQETSGVWGVLHGMPAHRQMLTPWFTLVLLLTILQMLRMNFFIASIRSQYRYMLDSEEGAELMNHFFDFALPIGGVAATPLIGYLLNNLSVSANFAVLTGFIAIIGVLNCLPMVWAGYATIVAFVVFRPLYYSAISDYATKVFGFATFGRIYGTLVCLSGITNLTQSGLDTLMHGPLRGNPTSINIAMGIGGTLIGVGLTLFTAVKGRVFAEERHGGELDEEEQKLLASSGPNYGT